MKCEYLVLMTRYTEGGNLTADRDVLIARFLAKGDAIAYAISRYSVGPNAILVFEVFRRGKKVYRAG